MGDIVLVIFDIIYNFERGIYKICFLCDFIESFMYDLCLWVLFNILIISVNFFLVCGEIVFVFGINICKIYDC